MTLTAMLLSSGVFLAAGSPALAGEPEDVSVYVRGNQVAISMLPTGGWSVTPGVAVSMDGSDFGLGSSEVREISGTTVVRYGLSSSTELVGQLQLGRTDSSFVLLGSRDSATFTTGTVEVGIRQLLTHYDDARPEVVVSATVGYPVGDLPDTEPHARVAIEAYQLIDPILISGEVGVSVGARTGVTHMDLRGSATFFVNDRLSLGAGVTWASAGLDFGRPLDTGVSVQGSVTLASPSGGSHLTASVSIGATQAAPDAVLGLTWSRSW